MGHLLLVGVAQRPCRCPSAGGKEGGQLADDDPWHGHGPEVARLCTLPSVSVQRAREAYVVRPRARACCGRFGLSLQGRSCGRTGSRAMGPSQRERATETEANGTEPDIEVDRRRVSWSGVLACKGVHLQERLQALLEVVVESLWACGGWTHVTEIMRHGSRCSEMWAGRQLSEQACVHADRWWWTTLQQQGTSASPLRSTRSAIWCQQEPESAARENQRAITSAGHRPTQGSRVIQG